MERIAASIAQVAAEALLRAGAGPTGQVVDLPPPVLEGLNAWIASRPDPKPTVPEAIRTGVTEWLSAQGYLPGEGAGKGTPRG